MISDDHTKLQYNYFLREFQRKSKSLFERLESTFQCILLQPMKCNVNASIRAKLMRKLRRKGKDNGTLTCGLKGLCILRASGSPPACENTTRDGGGR